MPRKKKTTAGEVKPEKLPRKTIHGRRMASTWMEWELEEGGYVDTVNVYYKKVGPDNYHVVYSGYRRGWYVMGHSDYHTSMELMELFDYYGSIWNPPLDGAETTGVSVDGIIKMKPKYEESRQFLEKLQDARQMFLFHALVDKDEELEHAATYYQPKKRNL